MKLKRFAPAGDRAQSPTSRTLSFTAHENTVPVIRAWTRLVLGEFGQADRADDAMLIISELVTNALRAAPGGLLRVSATRVGSEATLAVWDPGPGVPAVNTDALGSEEIRDCGRGLFIVAALAGDWGYEHTPADGGKWVWARV